MVNATEEESLSRNLSIAFAFAAAFGLGLVEGKENRGTRGASDEGPRVGGSWGCRCLAAANGAWLLFA